LERIKVTKAEYAALKKHLATIRRSAKRAA
jgi:hypothetical protein